MLALRRPKRHATAGQHGQAAAACSGQGHAGARRSTQEHAPEHDLQSAPACSRAPVLPRAPDTRAAHSAQRAECSACCSFPRRQAHSSQKHMALHAEMQHSKFTSMVEVWLSAEIQRRNLDQSGERTARGWWWVFPTTCTADSVPARACACRRVPARACACLCEVTASNHGECEVTK